LRARFGIWLLLALTAVMVVLVLVYDIRRATYPMSIDYNEGWNVVHASRVAQGQPLYRPISALPIMPAIYPPLSFWIMAGLAGLIPVRLLLLGRIIALVSFLAVAVCIYLVVQWRTRDVQGALLGGLLWLALPLAAANHYVAMYDPEMMGHAFSVAGLLLYLRWREELTTPRALVVAVLFSLGVFVKQLLVPLPIAVVAAELVERRQNAYKLLAAGLGCAILIGALCWMYGGANLLADALEGDRALSSARRWANLRWLFLSEWFGLLLLAFPVLARNRASGDLCVLLYAGLSLLLGGYAIGGDGGDRNYFFDFFIASALAAGLALARARQRPEPRARSFRVRSWPLAAAGLVPCLIGLGRTLPRVSHAEQLQRAALAYRASVAKLAALPGPALFEDHLLGYDAGKESLFTSFDGAMLILSGRIPETLIVEPIQQQRFCAIVLERSFPLQRLDALGALPMTSRPSRTVTERWTDNSLRAIREHYSLLESPAASYYYFFVPKGAADHL
jgi:hypothetical protein